MPTIQTVPNSPNKKTKKPSVSTIFLTSTQVKTLPFTTETETIVQTIEVTPDASTEPTPVSFGEAVSKEVKWFNSTDKLIIGICAGVLLIFISLAIAFQIRFKRNQRRTNRGSGGSVSPRTPRTPHTPPETPGLRERRARMREEITRSLG